MNTKLLDETINILEKNGMKVTYIANDLDLKGLGIGDDEVVATIRVSKKEKLKEKEEKTTYKEGDEFLHDNDKYKLMSTGYKLISTGLDEMILCEMVLVKISGKDDLESDLPIGYVWCTNLDRHVKDIRYVTEKELTRITDNNREEFELIKS